MKDPRYARVKILIEAKHITEINQIFENIPKTLVYGDLRMGFAAFKTRFNNPTLYTLEEVMRLAILIEIDPRVLIEMILLQRPAKKKR
jgi:hypothetical protein